MPSKIDKSGKPKKCCVDCPDGGRIRPAPHPGPRCATHHRVAVAARKERVWGRRLYAAYQITAEEYKRILDAQGGVCAGCRRATGRTKRLAVDHNHATGEVRGLLCSPCNRLLGHVRDDPVMLRRLAAYLTDPPARAVLS